MQEWRSCGNGDILREMEKVNLVRLSFNKLYVMFLYSYLLIYFSMEVDFMSSCKEIWNQFNEGQT